VHCGDLGYFCEDLSHISVLPKLREFRMLRVIGGKLPVLPCFLDVQQAICTVWPCVTFVKQKEYVPILTYGQMLSNKRIYT